MTGGAVLIASLPDGPPAVSVGRFSGLPVAPLAWPEGARSATLALPEAAPDTPPWQVLADGARGSGVCGSAAGG